MILTQDKSIKILYCMGKGFTKAAEELLTVDNCSGKKS